MGPFLWKAPTLRRRPLLRSSLPPSSPFFKISSNFSRVPKCKGRPRPPAPAQPQNFEKCPGRPAEIFLSAAGQRKRAKIHGCSWEICKVEAHETLSGRYPDGSLCRPTCVSCSSVRERDLGRTCDRGISHLSSSGSRAGPQFYTDMAKMCKLKLIHFLILPII